MRGQTGFTLAELLIVIAVISVLFVVVMVAINPAQRISQAQNTNTIAAAKQINSAIQQYSTLNSFFPNIGCGNSWCSTTVESSTFRDQIVNSGILKEIPAYPTPDFAGCAITYYERSALRYQLSFCLKGFDPRRNPNFDTCGQQAPGVILCRNTENTYLCWYYESDNLSRCFVGEDPPNSPRGFFPYP